MSLDAAFVAQGRANFVDDRVANVGPKEANDSHVHEAPHTALVQLEALSENAVLQSYRMVSASRPRETQGFTT